MMTMNKGILITAFFLILLGVVLYLLLSGIIALDIAITAVLAYVGVGIIVSARRDKAYYTFWGVFILVVGAAILLYSRVGLAASVASLLVGAGIAGIAAYLMKSAS